MRFLQPFSEGVRTRLRDRQLGSDRRAGTYARARARQQQYRFIRKSWRLLTLMAVLPLGLGVLTLSFMPDGQFRAFCGGLLVAGVVGALIFWVAQATGTASTMMGDLAEQWTASELRKLRRRGWRVLNHVKLRQRDIDHVLIGPGGVYAVETKWSADPWEIADHGRRVVNAAQQAADNAHDLWLWLKSYGVETVQSVVFLWGAGDATGADRTRCGDVVVLHGHVAHLWRDSLVDEGLADSVTSQVWQELDKHVRKRDARDADSERVPPSLYEYTRIGLAMFAAAVVAVVAVGEGIAHTHRSAVWVAVFAAALFVGVAGARLRRLRLLALGSIAGVAFSFLVLLGTYINAVA